MTEAWVKRSSERQRFLEELMRNIGELPGDEGDYATIELALGMKILSSFATEPYKIEVGFGRENAYSTELFNALIHTLLRMVDSAVETFGKTAQEKQALRMQVATGLIKSAELKAQSALSTDEMTNAEIYYDGHKAMDEVEL